MKIKFSIIFLSLSIFLSIFNFSCKELPGKDDPRVIAFLEQFDEEKFLVQIEEMRSKYEEVAKEVKEKEKTTSEIKEKYRATKKAYNQVLDDYIKDINTIKDIASFETFRPRENYKQDIERAKDAGDQFLAVAYKAIKGDTAFSPAVKAWVIQKLWNGIKEIHNQYLAYLKTQLELRINKAKFKNWGDI